MKCAVVKIGDTTAIVCGRGPKKKCAVCKSRSATKLCDWKCQFGGTCDVPLCSSCTFSPAEKKDLCPDHRVAYGLWVATRAAKQKTENK